MSAYAARRPPGLGLRALAQAVESVRRQSLEGRPPSGETDGLTRRPAPYPRPSPQPPSAPPARPGAQARPAPQPGPSPYPRPYPSGRSPRPDPARPDPPSGEDPVPQPVQDPAELLDRLSWQLVAQAQQGDAEAFGLLYDRYIDFVYRYIYYRVGDRSTAEDFTSETFLRAWRRIGSVTNQGRDVGAWLVTIARNIVLDHVKSSRYRLEITTADMLDADRHEDGPEGAVLDRLASAELLRAVRQLNADQQECIVLRFLQGLSVAETAAVMGRNEGAIKALQHRAVRRLATLLPEGFR
jgi:RNA polymerase sigma-70 factor, ECF subfamily